MQDFNLQRERIRISRAEQPTKIQLTDFVLKIGPVIGNQPRFVCTSQHVLYLPTYEKSKYPILSYVFRLYKPHKSGGDVSIQSPEMGYQVRTLDYAVHFKKIRRRLLEFSRARSFYQYCYYTFFDSELDADALAFLANGYRFWRF